MNGQPQINVDISNYIALKAQNAARIIKVDGVCHYAVKRFDPVQGTPQPMLVALKREDIAAQKAQLLAVVAALDAVIADIDTAKEI